MDLGFGKEGIMPSYSQRGQRICPVCNEKTQEKICCKCGVETNIVGKWSVRFKVKENGKYINKRLSGFDTKQSAENAYLSFVGTGVQSRLLGDLFEEYITELKRSLKGSTIYNKEQIFKLHILPYFQDFKVLDITKAKILDWRQKLIGMSNLKRNGVLSIKYLNNIRAEFCSFFAYLEERYDVQNIVKTVKPLKASREIVKEMDFYDYDEFKKLLAQIRRSKSERSRYLYTAFFSMLYFSGARVGEVLALSEDDIDLESGVVYISKSLTRKTPKGVPYKITSPKNPSSIRKIQMPKHLLATMVQYIEWKRRANISADFLFCGDKPLSAYSYTLALTKFCEKAKIKKIRIHDFRHSHASLLINLGANVALVSKRLGHTNTQQTLNTYSHLFPNYEKEIIKLLNGI